MNNIFLDIVQFFRSLPGVSVKFKDFLTKVNSVTFHAQGVHTVATMNAEGGILTPFHSEQVYLESVKNNKAY